MTLASARWHFAAPGEERGSAYRVAPGVATFSRVEPLPAVVRVRLAADWRRGACDVARRRRANQLRDSGCRRSGEPAHQTSARWLRHNRAPSRHSTQARMASADYSSLSNAASEAGDREGAPGSVATGLADAMFCSRFHANSASARYPGANDGPWRGPRSRRELKWSAHPGVAVKPGS